MARRLPPPTVGWHEFQHALEVEEGWLALTDVARREGVALTFLLPVFNTIWLWLVYGGWRDLYAAALEAWTGYPAKLSEAVASGRCAALDPGASLDATSSFIAYRGLTAVQTVRANGEVVGGP